MSFIVSMLPFTFPAQPGLPACYEDMDLKKRVLQSYIHSCTAAQEQRALFAEDVVNTTSANLESHCLIV